MQARATLISFGYLTQYQFYSKQKTERKYDVKLQTNSSIWMQICIELLGDGVLCLFRLTHLAV